ncbi:MAG: N-acetyl-gamma-glutamyl-phosphate reductase [Nitrospiria bacterium]
MKVAVIGATGYTGGELLRLMTQHPKVEVVAVTSKRSAGKTLANRLPFLKGQYDLTLEALNIEKIGKKADIIFIALAHTQAIEPVRQFINIGKKVIDLSADYRLRSPGLYEKWYGTAHSQPSFLKKAVYGLTEVYRKKIQGCSLVANPGCYPTGALLLLYPFLKEGVLDPSRDLIIDSKSGASGAGRNPGSKTHFPELNGGLSAYNIGKHRHLPEIEQELSRIGKKKVKALFTPYLLPVSRGILTTIYLPLKKKLSQKKIDAILDIYRDEPFIRRREDAPDLSHIRGSNFCDIAAFATDSGRTAILISAIDNLVKGASGQAIQNMNVMMGWDESLGLRSAGLFP